MSRFAVSRCLLPLLLGVAFLCLGKLRAADSSSFYIGKPDTLLPVRVGETDAYFIKVRDFSKAEKSVHVSFACVGKCQRHGRWYGRCIVRMNGRLMKPCLAPLHVKGRTRLEEANKAFPTRLETKKEKERAHHPGQYPARFYPKKTEVKDCMVMGHLYKHCVRYREEAEKNLASIELWISPDIGFVESTIKMGMGFGKGAEFSMNTRLESIHFAPHSN
jgi:hypothetical protein